MFCSGSGGATLGHDGRHAIGGHIKKAPSVAMCVPELVWRSGRRASMWYPADASKYVERKTPGMGLWARGPSAKKAWPTAAWPKRSRSALTVRRKPSWITARTISGHVPTPVGDVRSQRRASCTEAGGATPLR